MKKRRLPFVGFYLYALALTVLVVAYIMAISTFKVFSYDVDRFVIILPIFAMWIIILQITMSFFDTNQPVWFNAIDLAFCVLVLFTFAKTLIPFLTNIATFFTVNMGDVKTFAIGVPRCIASCVLLVVSCIIFIVGSFFKIFTEREAK